MLLTGSRDELCGPLSALFHAAAYHQLIVGPFIFPVFVYWKFTWRSAPCPSPFSSALRALRPLCCMFLFSSLFIIQVFLFCFLFLQSKGQTVQEAMLVYPRGSCGNITCCLFAHLLVCISHAGLEAASGSMGTLLFSQCNMAWRRFVWAGGSGCQSFDSSWWFFLPSVAPASQQNFWFTELMLSASAL
jgi:hypothetical protein